MPTLLKFFTKVKSAWQDPDANPIGNDSNIDVWGTNKDTDLLASFDQVQVMEKGGFDVSTFAVNAGLSLNRLGFSTMQEEIDRLTNVNRKENETPVKFYTTEDFESTA